MLVADDDDRYDGLGTLAASNAWPPFLPLASPTFSPCFASPWCEHVAAVEMSWLYAIGDCMNVRNAQDSGVSWDWKGWLWCPSNAARQRTKKGWEEMCKKCPIEAQHRVYNV